MGFHSPSTIVFEVKVNKSPETNLKRYWYQEINSGGFRGSTVHVSDGWGEEPPPTRLGMQSQPALEASRFPRESLAPLWAVGSRQDPALGPSHRHEALQLAVHLENLFFKLNQAHEVRSRKQLF